SNNITAEDQLKIETLFRESDTSGDGQLSLEEVAELVKNLGLSVTDDELVDAVESFDTSYNGKLNLKEFTYLYQELTKK
ncbi:hypothetical protein BG004_002394, partial [Podila humilis]